MSVRHVIHDNDRCRLVVEVDVGWVVLTLFFGNATTPVGTTGGFSSHASVHLSPGDARDRATLHRALIGVEYMTAMEGEPRERRRVSLDTLHRSICDVTRKPTA